MDNYNYPFGSDTDDAPWNEVEYNEEEIEVTVSITLSKTVKILVNDYRVEQDEDGNYIDFSDCDLKTAVEDQITLPQNLATYTKNIFKGDLELKAAGMPRHLENALKDCSNWTVDEFEVIKD